MNILNLILVYKVVFRDQWVFSDKVTFLKKKEINL